MATRIYRVWQPGNPKNRVFLPNFWMKLVKPKDGETLPQNFVRFEIPMEMSGHEVAEYLSKIYKLPVCEVKTIVEQGKMIRSGNFKDTDAPGWAKIAGEHGKVKDKEPDKKYAYAVMQKDFKFEFPDVFPKREEVTKSIRRQQKMENERIERAEQNWRRPGDTWFG